MKKYLLIIFALVLPAILFFPREARAMPLGTLLYRTSSDGQMYGYSGFDFIKINNGFLTHLYTGHVGIYVGKEDGVDYVVEALANGVVKTRAENFVNKKNGEVLVGAKLPINASPLMRASAVLLAKNIAITAPAYDFDFHYQKGPGVGQWICSGLAEKVYESASTGNPYDLRTLEYDENKYAVDITPDGFDNTSVVNSSGDVLSQTREFSKIAAREMMFMPASEKFGYNVGIEKDGDRFMFMPFTQFSQASLSSVTPDIDLSSSFDDKTIRGKQPTVKLIVKWSLVNNPLSSIRLLSSAISDSIFSKPAIASILTGSGATSSSGEVSPQVAQSKTSWDDLFPDGTYKIINNSTSTGRVTSTSTPEKDDNPEVARVIDGDSFVLKDGRKIRLLDVYAPGVISATRKTNECRGVEATELNRQLLSSGELILIPDPIAKKDCYSHWLYYVYVLKPDGSVIFVNEKMVESGLVDSRFCSPGKPSCPETSDLVRWKVIKEAGERAATKKAGFMAVCKAIKDAEKLASSTKPIIIPTSTPPIDPNTLTPTSTPKIPTTTPVIITPTSTATSTVKIPTTTPEIKPPVVKPPVVSPGGGSGGTPALPNLLPPLITKIFSDNNNHWLELFNPNDQPYDLGAYNYRLQKTKTSITPSIMLRFSDSADVSYNSAKSIAPKSSFLVVGSKSDESWLSKASAIALNSGFTWGNSGYTFYSGLNPISSADDLDIIETIGFGNDASFFSKMAAAALPEHGYLQRIKRADGSFSNTGNNFLDFEAFIDEPLVDITIPTTTPTTSPTSTDVLASTTPPIATSTEPVSSSTPIIDPVATTTPTTSTEAYSINSPDLVSLWHFDDCEGFYAVNSINPADGLNLPNDSSFDFGKNGCALKLINPNSYANVTFETPLDLNESSFAFDYIVNSGGRLSFILNEGREDSLSLDISQNGLSYTVNGFPGFIYLSLLPDSAWHQIVVTFDSLNQKIILYQDGKEVSQIFYHNDNLELHNLSISGSGSGSGILIDELAFWDRPLLNTELSGFFQVGKPYYSPDLYDPTRPPEKAFYWHLGEIESNFYWEDQPKRKVLPFEFYSRDFSFDLWYRNNSYPEDGRITLNLLSGQDTLVSSVISMWYTSWYFHPLGGMLYQPKIPYFPPDDQWHLFTLTYSSQEMVFRWYIDGTVMFERLAVWLKKPIKEVMINSENYPFILSDFTLWAGSLSQEEIVNIFEAGRPQLGY